MSMTREQADRVVKEAIEQGWAEEANREDAREIGEGMVDLIDFGTPPGVPGPGGNSGCIVELIFPGMYTSDKYWIHSTEDWRKLKAKVDELKQIIQEVVERGWRSASTAPKKAGKLGMYIEVVPPGGSTVYPVRVGGMRTWRKVCREADGIINQTDPQGRAGRRCDPAMIQSNTQGGES